MTWLRVLVVALLAGGAPVARAEAPDRAAVVILATTPSAQPLADNLTEVSMARVAQRGLAVVGVEEFRSGWQASRGNACFEDPSCLDRAAVQLGVTKIIAGTLSVERGRYIFHLVLRDARRGSVESRAFREVNGAVPELVKAVQEATEALFVRPLAPGRIQVDSEVKGARVFVDNNFVGLTPMVTSEVAAGRHRLRIEGEGRFPWSSWMEVSAGATLDVRLTEANVPVRRTWPAYAAWGTAAGAVLTLGGGGFLGALADGEASGVNRREAMLDLERRQRLGQLSTGMMLSAALLAGVSAFCFVRYREDIFGRSGGLDADK